MRSLNIKMKQRAQKRCYISQDMKNKQMFDAFALVLNTNLARIQLKRISNSKTITILMQFPPRQFSLKNHQLNVTRTHCKIQPTATLIMQ